MTHPVQEMIESLHAKGVCARLQVDATREGLSCPDFLREQWKERLVIDLDPSWPLNLEFTDEAVVADLAFDGFVERCTFPFRAIYVVIDRATNKGMVLDAHMPASVRAEREAAPRPRTEADDKAAGKRVRGKSRRHRRKKDQPDEPPTLGVVPAASETADTPDPPEEPALDPAASTDAEARRRRSGFSVIDGDG